MIKRRALIKTSAAAAIGFPAITHCKSPNSKLGIGLIGVGGRGRHHVEACKGEDIIALCDVNTTSLTSALKTAPNARTYKDIRDFYNKLDDIDAVVVATTEHTHAFATLPALQANKHVYCEKPLTRDVHECRIITEAAAKAGVQTQMGTRVASSKRVNFSHCCFSPRCIPWSDQSTTMVVLACGLLSKASIRRPTWASAKLIDARYPRTAARHSSLETIQRCHPLRMER